MVVVGVFDELFDLQIIFGYWGEVVLFYFECILIVFECVFDLWCFFVDYVCENLYVIGSGMWSEICLQ